MSAEFVHSDRIVHMTADVFADSMRVVITGLHAPRRTPFTLNSFLFHSKISRSPLPAGGHFLRPRAISFISVEARC